MEWQEEQVPRRKPSQKKPPKKANHKHHYKPCVYRVVAKYGHLDRERGFCPLAKRVPGTYCASCGKIGTVQYFWGIMYPREPSELPADAPEFEIVDDVCQKYVNLEEAYLE